MHLEHIAHAVSMAPEGKDLNGARTICPAVRARTSRHHGFKRRSTWTRTLFRGLDTGLERAREFKARQTRQSQGPTNGGEVTISHHNP